MRHGFLQLLSVAILLLAGWAHPASALDVPAPPRDYVLDQASLLSSAARAQLSRALAQFEAQTSSQVLVATFPSLEQESLEDFSIRLAERWQAGQKGKDNGVILLIFQAERLLRIEVGYGLEGVLPDALAGTIISNDITPLFREGEYEQGILTGVNSILQAVQGEYQAAPRGRTYSRQQELTPEQMAELQRQGSALFVVILIGLLGLFIFDVFRYSGYRRGHQSNSNRYSFWEWFFRFALLLAVLSIIFRMLFYMMLFSRGGYSGGRGGGGFSGGGGGFGGGGASGGW